MFSNYSGNPKNNFKKFAFTEMFKDPLVTCWKIGQLGN